MWLQKVMLAYTNLQQICWSMSDLLFRLFRLCIRLQGRENFYYRKYPKLVRTQVEIISEPNYLVRILFER